MRRGARLDHAEGKRRPGCPPVQSMEDAAAWVPLLWAFLEPFSHSLSPLDGVHQITLNQVGSASVVTGMKPYALTVGAALTIVLASCSSSSTTTGTASSAAAKPAAAAAGSRVAGGIVISGFAFSGTLTVKPGQKVTVTNQDSAAHTLTDKKSHLFDTGTIAGSGGTGTFTAPSKPGSYPFGCTFHPGMEGTLVVRG